MDLDNFLDNIKQQELDFYIDKANQLKEFNDKYRAQNEPTDINNEKQRNKWYTFIKQLDNISKDYDVINLSGIYKYDNYNYDKELIRLNKIIDEHLLKLKKSIEKLTGNNTILTELNKNLYKAEGEKGICNFEIIPIKQGPSGSVMKTRLKIDNSSIVEKEIILKPKPEDNEYIKQWKQREFNEYIKRNNIFWEKYNKILKFYKEAEMNLNNLIEQYYGTNYNNIHNNTIYKKTYFDKKIIGYKDKEVDDAFKAFKEAEKNITNIKKGNNYFYSYGNKNNWELILKEDIDKHFEVMRTKVGKYIGDIIEISPLYSTDNGVDYHFKGTKGSCDIEVIFAGGYNIQRLHTRWIAKNIHKVEENYTNLTAQEITIRMLSAYKNK